MTDSAWVNEWMRAWRSLAGAQHTGPWTSALDEFARSGQTDFQKPFAEAVDKLTAQSRAFFDLGQRLAENGGADWQQSVLEYLNEQSEAFADPQSVGGALDGASPLHYWHRFAGHDADLSRDRQSFMEQLDRLLRMPGLGYAREHDGDARELSRRWIAYEEAYGEYAAYCAETNRRAVERLREQLIEEFEQGRGPSSLRELYDAWVACSEDVYAERAGSDEYMLLHGRMVNALMAYKCQASMLIDRWAEALNMPTRAELDALHRQLKDVRRELQTLKSGPDGTSRDAE